MFVRRRAVTRLRRAAYLTAYTTSRSGPSEMAFVSPRLGEVIVVVRDSKAAHCRRSTSSTRSHRSAQAERVRLPGPRMESAVLTGFLRTEADPFREPVPESPRGPPAFASTGLEPFQSCRSSSRPLAGAIAPSCRSVPVAGFIVATRRVLRGEARGHGLAHQPLMWPSRDASGRGRRCRTRRVVPNS